MAHEDADTSRKVKKSLQQGVNEKEGKSRKKRSQPGTVQKGWNEAETRSRISVDSSSGDLKSESGMSDSSSKRLKTSKTELESMHVPNKMNLLVARAQDLDEDYDNI